MRKPAIIVAAASAVALVLGSMTIVPQVAIAADADQVAKGKKLAVNKKKGNCISCHDFKGANQAGNVGPPFVAMKARFPDKKKLRAQIWDATVKNPGTMMPPFGRHEILSGKEIDTITEWVYSL